MENFGIKIRKKIIKNFEMKRERERVNFEWGGKREKFWGDF